MSQLTSLPTEQEHLPPEEAKNLLAGLLAEFFEDDTNTALEYLEHCKFDLAALEVSKDILPAWLGHYRIGQGTYDTDRALKDFQTWPPIAGRIFELMEEKRRNESLAK